MAPASAKNNLLNIPSQATSAPCSASAHRAAWLAVRHLAGSVHGRNLWDFMLLGGLVVVLIGFNGIVIHFMGLTLMENGSMNMAHL